MAGRRKYIGGLFARVSLATLISLFSSCSYLKPNQDSSLLTDGRELFGETSPAEPDTSLEGKLADEEKIMRAAENAIEGFISGSEYAVGDKEPRESGDYLVFKTIEKGSMYFHQGEHDKAIEEYCKAIEIIDDALEVSSSPFNPDENIGTQVLRSEEEMAGSEGMIYYLMGLAYVGKGDDEKVEEFLGKFMDFYDGIEHPDAPLHKFLCLGGLAEAYRAGRDYDRAIRKYQQALELAQETGIDNQEMISICTAGLMDCYYRMTGDQEPGGEIEKEE